MDFVNLLPFFLFFLFGFGLFFLIGNLIFSLFNPKMGLITELFFKLITGLLFTIFVYLIILTKGKTFNLIPFGILLGTIIFHRREINFETYFSNLKKLNLKILL